MHSSILKDDRNTVSVSVSAATQDGSNLMPRIFSTVNRAEEIGAGAIRREDSRQSVNHPRRGRLAADITPEFQRLKELDRSGYASLLPAILWSSGWAGAPEQILEAIPYFIDDLQLNDLRSTLKHLGIASISLQTRLIDLEERHFPCVFTDCENPPRLVDLIDGRPAFVDPTTLNSTDETVHAEVRGLALLFAKHVNIEPELPSHDTMKFIAIKLVRANLFPFFSISILSGLFNFLSPLVILVIFDNVIATGSVEFLLALSIGVLAFVLIDIAVRHVRSFMMAASGTIAGTAVANYSFKKILALEPDLTELVPTDIQISRINHFNSLRDAFTNGVGGVLFEIPTTVLLLLLIALLGGWMAFIPMAFIVIMALLMRAFVPVSRFYHRKLMAIRIRRDQLVTETSSKAREIKVAGFEQAWLGRFNSTYAESAYFAAKQNRIDNFVHTLSHTLMMLAGSSTVFVGAYRVMANEMSFGALVACITVTWRILAPIKTAITALPQIHNLTYAAQQLRNLINTKSEAPPPYSDPRKRYVRGPLKVQSLSFRYRGRLSPIINSCSVTFPQNEVSVISGKTGSGKTTFLKLIAGQLKTPVGSIRYGDLTSRHVDPVLVRRQIAFLPQEAQFFHGTIRQNLQMVMPLASASDIERACFEANVMADIERLSAGFETRLDYSAYSKFGTCFFQKLALARTFLRKTSVVMLDDPTAHLDRDSLTCLLQWIERKRVTKTIVICSNENEIIACADNRFVIAGGLVIEKD